MKYEMWLEDVDKHMDRIADMTLSDLPDTEDLYSYWDAGYSARQTALRVLKANGWTDEEEG